MDHTTTDDDVRAAWAVLADRGPRGMAQVTVEHFVREGWRVIPPAPTVDGAEQ